MFDPASIEPIQLSKAEITSFRSYLINTGINC